MDQRRIPDDVGVMRSPKFSSIAEWLITVCEDFVKGFVPNANCIPRTSGILYNQGKTVILPSVRVVRIEV
jgi:hypothetical protein